MNTIVKNNSFSDLFQELFNGIPSSNNWYKNVVNPLVNISEDDNGYQIELVAPGLKKDDFKVNLEKGLLTISYEKQEEKEENKGKKTHRLEYRTSSFKRSFNLDDNIDADKIEASYVDGILKLSLPKKEEVKVLPKEIAIK